jgi:hypothetical protein
MLCQPHPSDTFFTSLRVTYSLSCHHLSLSSQIKSPEEGCFQYMLIYIRQYIHDLRRLKYIIAQLHHTPLWLGIPNFLNFMLWLQQTHLGKNFQNQQIRLFSTFVAKKKGCSSLVVPYFERIATCLWAVDQPSDLCRTSSRRALRFSRTRPAKYCGNGKPL